MYPVFWGTGISLTIRKKQMFHNCQAKCQTNTIKYQQPLQLELKFCSPIPLFMLFERW